MLELIWLSFVTLAFCWISVVSKSPWYFVGAMPCDCSGLGEIAEPSEGFSGQPKYSLYHKFFSPVAFWARLYSVEADPLTRFGISNTFRMLRYQRWRMPLRKNPMGGALPEMGTNWSGALLLSERMSVFTSPDTKMYCLKSVRYLDWVVDGIRSTYESVVTEKHNVSDYSESSKGVNQSLETNSPVRPSLYRLSPIQG